jgi:hypothetical protein
LLSIAVAAIVAAGCGGRTREPGAVNPTGSPTPSSSEFERPRNEGDLL